MTSPLPVSLHSSLTLSHAADSPSCWHWNPNKRPSAGLISPPLSCERCLHKRKCQRHHSWAYRCVTARHGKQRNSFLKKKNNKEERRGIECSAEKRAKTLFKYVITKHLEHLQFWLIQSHSLKYLYKNPSNLILVLTWSNLGISKYEITSCWSIKSPENSRSDKLFSLYNEL